MKADMIDPAELKAYDDWVVENLDALVRKHPGKVVGVYKGKLIAIEDSYKEVYAAARKQGIKDPPFVMEIPFPEDFESIL